MARFRTSGTAHDGQPWTLAPALVTFAKQIEALRPTNHPTDGTVAGAGHDQNNPNSDHTVWPKSGSGVVYAIDVGNSEGTVPGFTEALRASRDPRIKYLIHNRRIFSSYPTSTGPAWSWRPYSGYNAHLSHMHLSVHHTSNLSTDARTWALGQAPTPEPGDDDMLITKMLTKEEWTELFNAKPRIAFAASLEALLNHWMNAERTGPNPQRTEDEHRNSSKSIILSIARSATSGNAPSAGLPAEETVRIVRG